MAVNLKMRRASTTATEILMLLLLIMVAILASINRGSAQQEQQTCAAKLVPCANSLNMTNPPDTCCEPLRDALTNDLPCLCSIFNDPNILKAFKIDPKLATQLPKHCGIPSFSTTNACANTTTGPSASTPPDTSGENNIEATSTAWLGLSGLMSFLFWLSMME